MSCCSGGLESGLWMPLLVAGRRGSGMSASAPSASEAGDKTCSWHPTPAGMSERSEDEKVLSLDQIREGPSRVFLSMGSVVYLGHPGTSSPARNKAWDFQDACCCLFPASFLSSVRVDPVDATHKCSAGDMTGARGKVQKCRSPHRGPTMRYGGRPGRVVCLCVWQAQQAQPRENGKDVAGAF